MTTIRDVAQLAGVSIKSVSRVLNEEPVGAEMKVRVMKAMSALGYRPNLAARRLSGRKSYLIAMLYASGMGTTDYLAALQSAAAIRCRERGRHLVIEPISTNATDIDEAVARMVESLRPDGFILLPPLSGIIALIAALERHGMRHAGLATGKRHGTRDIVTPEEEGGRIATQHLIDLGHRRIAIITPPDLTRAAHARCDGYTHAMANAGLSCDPALSVAGDFSFASGFTAAERLLGLLQRPTAIFATNDAMALGVIAAANRLGMRVPDDVSVVGFDDSAAAVMTWPPLTTVRQPLEEIGRELVDRLLDDEPTPYKPLFSLIVRETTAERSPAALY
jgi:LacI family transcriptional regulator